MSDNVLIPSYNPADIDDEAGFYEFIIKKTLSKIQKMTPAKVISYDRQKNRAVVQPLTYDITSTGGTLPMDTIPNIPVLTLSGGGFIFSFPVAENQTGWLISADRDISVFKKILNFFTPATLRRHQYEDGIFIPDNINGFNIAEGDESAVILTSSDGTTKITVQKGRVEITAPDWVINGNGVINGDLNINGTMTAAVVIAQNGATGTFANSVSTQNGIVTEGS